MFFCQFLVLIIEFAWAKQLFVSFSVPVNWFLGTVCSNISTYPWHKPSGQLESLEWLQPPWTLLLDGRQGSLQMQSHTFSSGSKQLIYTEITPLAAWHLQRACSHSLNCKTGQGMLRTADHSPTFREPLWGSQHTGHSLHYNQHGNNPSARGRKTKPVLPKWKHHWIIYYSCLGLVLGFFFCTYLNIWDKNIPAERKEK